MTTATPVDMDEDLTEVPELTSEQLEVLAGIEERFIKGRGYKPADWDGIVDPYEEEEDLADDSGLSISDEAIVPPDCEFLEAATDGPGDDDDSSEEDDDDDDL